MKKEKTIPTLKGTPKEMANQLFSILKDKDITISKEKLKEIIPMSNNFISAFTEVLKEQISSDKQANNDFNETIRMMNEGLIELIRDGKLSEAEKIKALDIISELAQHLREMEKQRKENDTDIKKCLIAAMTFVITLIVYLGSGGRVKLPQKKA